MMRRLPRRITRVIPYLGLLLTVAISFVLIPPGHTLWAKVLGITGTIETRQIEPPEFEGCSPGFWKQPKHFDDWPGVFSPEDKLSDVFGSDAPPDLTLLGALQQGGGGINALLRQAVAALLNAAHEGVDYPITLADVILMTQAALQPGGDVEGTKDIFEAANELGCGLSDGEDDDGEDGEDDQCESDDEDGCEDEGQDSSQSDNTENSDVGPDQTPESYEGCAADYWENEENLTEWPEGLNPEALFSEVFEIELAESPTLFETLSFEGDAAEDLMREATAALLNALSSEVEFEKSAEEIIELFQTAYLSGDPELIADTTEQLGKLNNGDCPWPGDAETGTLTESVGEVLEPTATPVEPTPTETATQTP